MELRHLRYLLAVADHRNFTRAAEVLHVSQPTLSQQIKQLEREVGVPLLDRSGRTVRLTDAGEAYAQHGRLALQDLDAAERAVHDVHDLSRGHLRIAMTPTITAYLIGPLVRQFHAEHPGVTLTVIETTQDLVEADLLADRIDLGIAFAGHHAAGVAASALFTETLSLVVGVAHPLHPRARTFAIADLPTQPLALLSRDFATRNYIDEFFAAHNVTPRIAIEANSISALIEFVRLSTLATVLPDAITQAQADLHPIRPDPPLPSREVVLLHRSAGYQSAAARAFSAMAVHYSRHHEP
ncbi:transcriptional regulator CynR [Mycolicibacterium peregrinum]|uniref:Probable hydrogen peroxide-inducible genes activator n=1 Tax=Mycolicibacterium peregrinum TaxID=43304 RepID=A0A1A0RAK7_MYCPR|nr:transcriptional regulator CynR [Mycolicibacterium peregrinum]OBB31362.1 transcriptional regulator CynR [Mycolicibacterium peregrinum]